MNVLICNAGSTSLKFKLYSMPDEYCLAECRIERVGNYAGGYFYYKNNVTIKVEEEEHKQILTYRDGIIEFLSYLTDRDFGVINNVAEIDTVGFKTVLARGYYGDHIIDSNVMRAMSDFAVLAPVHNRCYIEAITTMSGQLPDAKMVGCFETAFHQTMPPEAFIYSVPFFWYEQFGVRRMGYHGASHSYVSGFLNSVFDGRPYRAVSCHLGGSSSLCAIQNGRSIDTSFGMSLQAGIMQTTRAGDIDPFLPFAMNKFGKSYEEIQEELNSESGLYGVSGVSGDFRDIEKAAHEGNKRARLAVNMYCRDIIKTIGSYTALMSGLDAIVFTGGIGENSGNVRMTVMGYLDFLGIEAKMGRPDGSKNFELTERNSPVRVFVVAANEELMVARRTFRVLEK